MIGMELILQANEFSLFMLVVTVRDYPVPVSWERFVHFTALI